jgi:NADPH:quinone reductase-like Zn-dependent oxidoreductase
MIQSISNAVTATEVVLPGIVEPAGLQVRQRELPAPEAGQALVRIEASGISFAEQAMRRGLYPGQPKFPFIPGYDLVGTVQSVGAGVDSTLVGRRVAAITETGGWASHTVLTAADLIPVPDGIDPAEAETFVVNGVTAWQMLHRTARVTPGQTILVHGANGGVGTTLVQLARHHGVRVIGVASSRHHAALRGLGVLPVDYADTERMVAQIRELAPNGVDAVFDNIGGATLQHSWRLLAPKGTLVSYAISSAAEGTGSMLVQFMLLIAQLGWWNALPNGHKASFYDLWDRNMLGKTQRPIEFRARLHEDLTAVLKLLSSGALSAKIAARMPLTNIREAMELAESRTVLGKVILEP